MANKDQNVDSKYLPELMAEKDSIDSSFVHALRLITKEIENIQNPTAAKETPESTKESDMVNIYSQKMPKTEVILKVPVAEFPRVNFVGRIIGPGGSTLKGIQDVTNTRIAVLGKGSQRDKKKADELLESGDPKWAHMRLPLHVKISAVGPVDQAHLALGRACGEVMKLMQVEDDEYMDGTMLQSTAVPRGTPAASRGRGGTRGRGAAPQGGGRGRGGARGGMQQSSGANRTVVGGRGGARGAVRGGNVRGTRGATRGSAVGGRFAAQKQQMAMVQPTVDPYAAQADPYGYGDYAAETGYEAYGEYMDAAAYADPNALAAETYADAYAAEGTYGQEAYDAYGYADAYSAYGNGTTQAAAPQQTQYGQANKPFRGKMVRGGARGRGASKPY